MNEVPLNQVLQRLLDQDQQILQQLTQVLLVVLGCGVFLVSVGRLMADAGLCRSKNAGGTALRHLTALCMMILVFYAIGAPIFCQAGNGVLGFEYRLLGGGMLWHVLLPQILFWMMSFLIAAGVIVGALQERTRFVVIPWLCAIMAGLVLPVMGHWAWSGWLGRLGLVDVGGASVIHLPAAVAALAGAILVGPRSGKYNHDGSANGIRSHNVPLAVVGAMVIVLGWIPYMLGATVTHGRGDLASAAGNVIVAAAAGGIAAMVYARVRFGKAELFLTLVGLLAALVAISACGGLVPVWAAVMIGAISAALAIWLSLELDLRYRIDDPTAVISIHGVGAIVGMIGMTLFTSEAGTAAFAKHLGVQILGLLTGAILSAVLAGGTLLILRKFSGLRSAEADEYDGLDLAEHDINAYPDFQQTMIKSYHLREA